jgi:transcriptional regulator with XRE-family HTH domain
MRVKIYRTYRFGADKDPICYALRTLRQDEGLKNSQVATLAGVAAGTFHNICDGGTRRPQNATVTAISSALGYVRHDRLKKDGSVEVAFEKAREYDWKDEIKRAADWMLKNDAATKKRAAKRKKHKNGGA